MKLTRIAIAALLGLALAQRSADATWSICIADTSTKEIAVGTVTCLNQFDLLAIVPVVVVNKGVGACQASGDFDGIRRPVMFEGIADGTPPDEILEALARISGHQSRQYGIADVQGRTMTFTGAQALDWAGGVTGQVGDIVYAIQGNILTGACVVASIEDAIISTPGDIPLKLMEGMRAARDNGGDGRCSCPGDPTGCGCPPQTGLKSGHIGGVIVARTGDTDDDICNASGCADGDYFLRLNVAFQTSNRPDPVTQLDGLFADWRAALVGRPDAIRSVVAFTAAGDGDPITMTIELRDWQNLPPTVDPIALTVEHEPDSARATTIGPVVDEGGGVFTVTLAPTGTVGMDRFRVQADDGIRPVILMPSPENCVGDPGKDCNGNCTPDELEEDCNDNGIPDDCDIDSGFSGDVNGNRIPDECEDVTWPEQLNVAYGALRSGTIEDVRESDDAYLTIEQRPAFTPLLPLIRVDVLGTSPFAPASEFGYTLEAAATALPPNVPQRIEFYDFDRNRFVLVDERTATTTDSVARVTITTDPNRFIWDNRDQVYALLSWFDPGNVLFVSWTVRIDQAVWNIQP